MINPQEHELTPESYAEPPIDVVPSVRRKLAWDMIPHDEVASFLPHLGLLPSSKEGSETEHLNSHVREHNAELVRELVQVYSALTADILGTVLLPDSAECPVTEDQRKQFTQQNFTIINTAAFAMISQFLDDGLFVIPACGGRH